MRLISLLKTSSTNFSSENTLTILSSLIIILMLILMSMLFYSFSVRKYKLQNKMLFYNTLISGIESGLVKDYKGMINLYKGCVNMNTENINYRNGLTKWLRELLPELMQKEPDLNFQEENKSKLVSIISNFIEENESTSPFSDLPDIERNILTDITIYMKNNDSESSSRKINELSSVILTRYNEQKRAQNINRYSIPLAILGVGLTIIFGVLSL